MQEAQIFFPYETIRDVQGSLIKDLHIALEQKQHAIVHAPTGLGKSAASLSVALKFAIEKKLTVFFLTSRHTQHDIAVETLKEIQVRYDLNLQVVDLIGKKWMCPVPGTNTLATGEFNEYCKKVREDQKCSYYVKSRKNHQLTTEAKAIIGTLNSKIHHNREFVRIAANEGHCPYEIALERAKQAQVIVADYNYIFNQHLSESFLRKISKYLNECIVIVDEAHNLPARIRDGVSAKLTSAMIQRAIKEAQKYQYEETQSNLRILDKLFQGYHSELLSKRTEGKDTERLSSKAELLVAIELSKPYNDMTSDLAYIGEAVQVLQKRSAIAGIAAFLEEWKGPDEGFTRILRFNNSRHGRKEWGVELSYQCLDPSVITANIIDNTYACIFMSGTLTPTGMYRDLLGVADPFEKEYPNPFPKKNSLNMIVPKTTTQYTKRTEQQFLQIGEECKKCVEAVPGNTIVFFPSYYLRDQVYKCIFDKVRKTIFLEQPEMAQQEKNELLEKFKQYKETGAVLLGVVGGNYAEGVDLPGDFLKGVIIVGLPLQQPDLETKELITYFDKKFKRGWDYGYILPAFNKALQSAGRCIRSETDAGVITFLDERYLWPQYKRCFPRDQEYLVTKEPSEEIRKFFEEKGKTNS